MKDIQGIQRGKCNWLGCECEEYRAPSSDSPSRFRCEYCNHTPAEHVKIIPLGKCKCGDCEEYQSEDENSYTECGYCGCEASEHEGAEKLRKPTAPAVQPGVVTGNSPPMMQQLPAASGVQPRLNAYGQPVQTAAYGTCINPGCPYPKRVEPNGKVHDFCSRTCSQKYAAALGQQQQSGAHTPQTGVSSALVSFLSSLSGQSATAKQPGPGGSDRAQPPTISGGSMKVLQQPPPPAPAPAVATAKMCTHCKKSPANSGRSWCEQCYVLMKGTQS